MWSKQPHFTVKVQSSNQNAKLETISFLTKYNGAINIRYLGEAFRTKDLWKRTNIYQLKMQQPDRVQLIIVFHRF